MQQQKRDEGIITKFRQKSNLLRKVVCCEWVHCLQKEVILTSNMRKQTLQKLIRQYVIDENENTLYDPIKLMILIYLCEDKSIPNKHIQRCRINPDIWSNQYRTDLQFYIPQICNYIVFHIDLGPNYLIDVIEKSSRLNYTFAHLFYFYMLSLEKSVNDYEIHSFKQIQKYNQKFIEDICKHYQGKMLNSVESVLGQQIKTFPTQPNIGYLLKIYGTQNQQPFKQELTAEDIALPNYVSIFEKSYEPQAYSFRSMISFFKDLFMISESLKKQEDKVSKLKIMLKKMNQRLPSSAYVPFFKNGFRFYNILNIVVQQAQIFPTKSRNPFSIYLQVFCPAQVLSEHQETMFWEKLNSPLTLKGNLQFEITLRKKTSNIDKYYGRSRKLSHSFSQKEESQSEEMRTEILVERQGHLTNKLLQFTNSMRTQPRFKKSKRKISIQLEEYSQQREQIKQKFKQIFGEKENQLKAKIKAKSIFGRLESWDLMNIMIKTNDNLKQEQFAMQLICQFDYIFQLEKVPLILTPYEVISMGPDCGIIEMVKDSVTLSKLKRVLKINLQRQFSLKQFFEMYYADKLTQAKEIFLKSLVGYSLVMYFLQAKDRHNGNIMLHSSGKIFHIDFGFFLSNLPGKGIELQKNVPFKLMKQYIEVLDGEQNMFEGFKAVKKHQNKILMLVKMMYSSSGVTMPCFVKGQQTIEEMELRFNPPQVSNDAQLNRHCQQLINISIDNRHARWYDYWQYYFQGIFY